MEVEESSVVIDNNSSLISQCQRIQYDSTKEWSRTTTTSHGNRKVWIELTIFLKTITLWHFPAKSHFSLKFFGRICRFWSWLLKVRKVLCRVVYFYLMYICIPLFWWNNISALFFFWYILLLVPACLELMLWEIDGKSHAFSMG